MTLTDNNNQDSLPILSYKDLHEMNLPPVEFLIDKLVPEIGLTMFQGHPGSFKSWFAYYVAHCVANGLPLLDQFKTKKRNVLLISPDDYLPTMKERLKLIGFLPEVAVDIWNPIKQLDVEQEEIVEQLKNRIEDEDIGLIIIDTLRQIHFADENNSSEMSSVMQNLSYLAEKCCVILIHHLSKGGMYSHTVASRGSTVIPASLISGFNFKYDKKQERIFFDQFKNKIGTLMKPLSLQFNLDYSPLFKIDMCAKSEDLSNEIIENIRKQYEENPEPEFTKDEFITAFHELSQNKYSHNAIKSAFERLIEEGFLIHDGISRSANRKCYMKNPKNAVPDIKESVH